MTIRHSWRTHRLLRVKLGFRSPYHTCVLSRAQLSAAPWTAAHQAPLSMEFSRQEYWSELPLPSPGYLPDPEVEPASLTSPALASGFLTTVPPGKP